MALTLPARNHAEDFSEGSRVVEPQKNALPALVTKSTTSALLPQGGMNNTAAAQQLGPYALGIDYLAIMLTPFPPVSITAIDDLQT